MLLAIDSSTAWTGIALYDVGMSVLIAESCWRTETHHAEQLVPAIGSMLERQSMGPDVLSAVGVAIGPGTFNGVRVGVATAKLIARARDIPIVGVNTLEIYAAAHLGCGSLVRPIIGAALGEVATGLWRAGERLEVVETAHLARIDDLLRVPAEPTLYVGELKPEWRTALQQLAPTVRLATPGQSLRRPGLLAELAAARAERGETDDVAALVPLYLRPPHISRPRR